MLVSIESSDMVDNSTLSVACSQEQFRTIEASLHQVTAQNDSKRTTDISAANGRREEIRCVARYREEVRSEEQVRQEFSIRSIYQQHQ